MRKYLLVLVSALSISCASAPTGLSPVAKLDFNNTRAIKSVDLIRDTAIDANSQIPPLLSTAATKKVVSFHKATLAAIDADKVGWRGVVSVLLTKLQNDPELLPSDLAYLRPYLSLVKTLVDSLVPTNASLEVSRER